MNVKPLLLSLSLASLASLAASAQATDLNARVVQFANGWEPGIAGSGEVRLTAAATAGPNRTFQFSFTTNSVDNNLEIAHTITGIGPEPASGEEELLARLTAAVTEPDFVVDTSGRFVGLADLQGLRRSLRDDIRSTFARLNAPRSDAANFERFVERATSQELLEGRVAEDWHRMVSRWIDKRLAVGKEYRFDDVVGLPIPRQTPPKLSMHGSYRLTRLESCDRAGVARTCAVVVMHLEPDEKDLARVTREVYANTPTVGKDPADAPTMQVAVDAEVVTEADSLVPHRYSITRKVDLILSKDEKNTQHILDQRETTFTYR